jgi:hypothetical protein
VNPSSRAVAGRSSAPFAAAAGLLVAVGLFPSAAVGQAPGGFVEKANSTATRSLWTAAQIQSFLPTRGRFTFPAPYGTEGVRLTNASDCGGTDCVHSVGYSYWRNINNHVGSDTMLIFLGLRGRGPSLFSYHKVTGEVVPLGPLFDASHPLVAHSGEGWYFSATQPTKLYLNTGPKLFRYDVLARTFQTVFDATSHFGGGRYIWQVHSSDDDKVHSATLRDSSTFAMLGCMAYREDVAQFSFYPAVGNFDECQLDKSGDWLLIKDNVDGIAGEDNRIINLQTGIERVLLDQNGAAGHSDNGYGYLVADDNWATLPGTIRYWDFNRNPLFGPMVYHTVAWAAGGIGHIAHANSRPGAAPSEQYVCGGGATTVIAPRANEIVCFRLDTSLDVLVVTQNMTNLNATGGGDGYTKLPKGNLDVTGRYFIWASNMGGSRNDAFIVKVPSQFLVDGGDETPPTVVVTEPVAGATVFGVVTVEADASDNVGVVGVQFKVDGIALGGEVLAPPHFVNWNTAGAANGFHTLTAVARDAAGNTATSLPVAVTVNNPLDTTPPVLSGIGASTITSSSAMISWATNEPADTQVEYGLTIAYGSFTPLAPALVPSHSQVVSGLASAKLYHYRVRSRDAAGNLAVSADFTFTTLVAPGPSAHWKLDEGTGTTSADASGNGHLATLVNGTAWAPGRSGKALSLDGIDDYARVPHAAALNAFPFSLSAWFKTSTTAGVRGLVNKYVASSFNGYQIFFNAGDLCAWFLRDTSNYVYDGTGCSMRTPGYNDGQWHHVVLVVDAAGGRLYVDKVQKASLPWTGTSGAPSTTQEFRLGHYPGAAGGAEYLPGLVDGVRIYDRALSSGEISQVYDEIPPVETVPPVISGVTATGVTATAATIGWTTNVPADSQVEYGKTLAYGSFSPLDPELVLSHSQELSGLAPATLYHYRVRSRDAAGNLAVSPDFTFTILASPSVVAHWKLDEGTGATSADSSGNGQLATLMNGAGWAPGRSGQGLSLDGVNDFARVPHAAALNAFPLTLSAWFKTGATTGVRGLVNKYVANSYNGYQIFFVRGDLCAWFLRDGANYVYDGGNCSMKTPGYTNGQWHHVALVIDQTGGKLYLDKVLKASLPWTGAAGAVTTTQDLRLGHYPGAAGAAEYLPGLVDDVRIYNRALSAAEIAQMYDGAAP